MTKKSAKKEITQTYKMIELVGTSPKSYEEAIGSAIQDASKSLQGLDWFEVMQLRGAIKEGKVAQYQAIIKVGFKVLR